MAYPINDEALQLFLKPYRQTLRITCYGTHETFQITGDDIIVQGFDLSRYTATGNNLELGSCVASELNLLLDNRDGRFDSKVLEGAELFVEIGIKKWDAARWENAQMHYIPLGYFTIDNSPKYTEMIDISALDRMMRFSVNADFTGFTFPATAYSLLLWVCGKCGVALADPASVANLPNSLYEISTAPAGSFTFRNVLQWLSQLLGCCAYMDWDGNLRLGWYGTEDPVATIDPTVRYTGAVTAEQPVSITGLQLVDVDGKVYTAGTDVYPLTVEGNKLITHDHQTVVDTIFTRHISGLTYVPFNCAIRPFINIYPMDSIVWKDKKGNTITTVVTETAFSLNTPVALQAVGDTEEVKRYVDPDPLTNRQQAVLDRLQVEVEKDITSRQQAVIDLNDTIASSLGLYTSSQTLADGSVVYYYHNKPTLPASTIIYTWLANGFAWTSGENCWNDGAPVWQYGFTKDGNAVYNALSTYKIQTDLLEAGSVTTEKLSVEYRQSVENGFASVRQEFTVADGKLQSNITAETERAQGVESSLSSSITQNSEAITAEVTRATGAENTLSGRIAVNANAITAEVTRATGAEGELSGRITVNANAISAEVTRATGAEGELSGRITVNAGAITAEVTRATDAENTLSGRIDVNAGAIEAKVSQSGGDVSFSWSLLATGFSILASGAEVFRVNSAGATLTGTFYVDSGRLGTSGAGWSIDSNSLYTGTDFATANSFLCTGSGSELEIAGHTASGWVLKAGDNFGVLNSGAAYMTDAHINGGEVRITSNYTGLYEDDVVEEISISTDGILLNTEQKNGGSYQTRISAEGDCSTITSATDLTSLSKRFGYIGSTANNMYCGMQVFLQEIISGQRNTGIRLYAESGVFLDFQDTIFSTGGSHSLMTIAQDSSMVTCKGTWSLSSGEAITSDAKQKNSIESIPEAYDALFDGLQPRVFKYNDGQSGRTHTGFIAQEVAQSAEDAGVALDDLGCVCVDKDDRWGIRYSEIIALNTRQIQLLKARIKALEERMGVS